MHRYISIIRFQIKPVTSSFQSMSLGHFLKESFWMLSVAWQNIQGTAHILQFTFWNFAYCPRHGVGQCAREEFGCGCFQCPSFRLLIQMSHSGCLRDILKIDLFLQGTAFKNMISVWDAEVTWPNILRDLSSCKNTRNKYNLTLVLPFILNVYWCSVLMPII